jgi:hypothetical protein
MAERGDQSVLTSVEIEGVDFEAPHEVLALLEAVSEERDDLRADNARYVEALEEVEWVDWVYTDREGYRSVGNQCPWCRGLKESGHKKDCIRQAALSDGGE